MPTMRLVYSILMGSWLCVATSSCGAGDDAAPAGQNPMVAPGSAAGGQLHVLVPPDEEQVDCYPDANCTCADGRMGAISCAGGGAGTCECDQCPQFMAAAIPPFDACGGEPFGLWQLEAMTSPALDVDVTERDAQGFPIGAPASCTGTIQNIEPPNFIIDLQDAGALRYHTGPYVLTVDILEECISHEVGRRCDTVQIDDCQDLCGICQCQLHRSGSALIEPEWTRAGSVLSLSSLEFQYCVQGDVLTLRDAQDLDYRMRRVTESSAPAPCANRTTEQCVAGCTLGLCSGTGTCADATEESNCTNRQGCSWNPDTCIGEPDPCSLSAYGIVPGCDLIPVSP
jgi:hypothetical protein